MEKQEQTPEPGPGWVPEFSSARPSGAPHLQPHCSLRLLPDLPRSCAYYSIRAVPASFPVLRGACHSPFLPSALSCMSHHPLCAQSRVRVPRSASPKHVPQRALRSPATHQALRAWSRAQAGPAPSTLLGSILTSTCPQVSGVLRARRQLAVVGLKQ